MRVAAIVVAAGRGERLGGDAPKALVRLGERTLVAHAIAALSGVPGLVATVVAHPPDHESAFRAVVDAGVTLVGGGETRAASVRAAFGALTTAVDVVVIHDAARPLAPSDLAPRVVDAIRDDVIAAAPALAVADTLKRADASRRVIETIDRAGLWAVQTPQAVRRDVLAAALAWEGAPAATDDLGLVEAAIAAGVVVGQVVLVAGDVRALKVTHDRDLLLAESLLASHADTGSAGG